MSSENRCQAAKYDYMKHLIGRCNLPIKVEINKMNLCIRHGQQEALAILVKSGKAKRVFVPIIVKEAGEPVLTYEQAVKLEAEQRETDKLAGKKAPNYD